MPAGLHVATPSPPTTQELLPHGNGAQTGLFWVAVCRLWLAVAMAPGRQVREALLRGTASSWLLLPTWRARFLFPPSSQRAKEAGWTHTGVCSATWQQHPAEVDAKEGGISVGLHFGYTLLPTEHSSPARSTMAALFLPRGGNPSAQITNAAFLISPASASEKASSSHLTQKHSMVPMSILDTLGTLLFTSTC